MSRAQHVELARISGHRGGSVDVQSRFGQIIRKRVKMKKTNTPAQQIVKANHSSNSKTWTALTQPQRDAWDILAKTIKKQSKKGFPSNLNGFTLFMLCNNNLLSIGAPTIADAPVPPSIPADIATVWAIAFGAGTMNLTFTGAVPAGFRALISATPGVKASKKYVRNLKRIITVFAAATATPQNVQVPYSVQFPFPVVGYRCQVFFKLIHIATGFAGQESTLQAIVAP